jgi:hypothetical protein
MGRASTAAGWNSGARVWLANCYFASRRACNIASHSVAGFGRLEDTVAAVRKQKLVCLESGLKKRVRVLLYDAGEGGQRTTRQAPREAEVRASPRHFAELKMWNECDVVQAALHDIDSVR